MPLKADEYRLVRRPPRIGIVSLSAVPDDPRVRRQGDLFASHGWDVQAFGLAGAQSALPEWRYFALEGICAPQSTVEQEPVDLVDKDWLLWWRRSQTARRFRRLIQASRTIFDPRHAKTAYWTIDPRFVALRDLASRYAADIWLANDWQVLPVAQYVAQQQDVPYIYDTHELALHEYAHRWLWQLLHRPVIAAVEQEGICEAALTSCVSPGIAKILQSYYRLPKQPLVVRNLPRYEPHRLRSCGETIEVLYHGVVSPGRGLEACIDSVAAWRPHFRLTIRGPGSAQYREKLIARAKASSVAERVIFAPPVAMVDLVSEAVRFDIGLFALPDHSKHNVYALPNKLFEYMMAGLALCITDLPEMTSIMRQYDVGRSISAVTAAAIADAINGFDRASIECYKARSLEAAKVLNWEREGERYFAAVAEVLFCGRKSALRK